MLTIDRVYKIRQINIVTKHDGGKLSIIKIADPNLGMTTYYDLQVDGTVLANKGDRIIIGKITGVNSKAFNPKERSHIYSNCQIKCEISGQNVIPN